MAKEGEGVKLLGGGAVFPREKRAFCIAIVLPAQPSILLSEESVMRVQLMFPFKSGLLFEKGGMETRKDMVGIFHCLGSLPIGKMLNICCLGL